MRKLLWLVSAVALAQHPEHVKKDTMVFIQDATAGGMGAGENVHFIAQAAGPTAIAGGVRMFSAAPSPVKGAPYSAEAVNERVQVLADGTRISEKSSSKMFRDSEGRSRTETVLGGVGSWIPDLNSTMVFIDDPVAGVHYTLNPNQKTAMKMVMPKVIRDGNTQTKEFQVRSDIERRVVVKDGKQVEDVLIEGPAIMATPAIAHMRHPMDPNAPQPTQTVTSLGKRTMEGVEVEGTRTVEKFPAGMFGNDRPIEVTSERWYSSELKLEVMRKHNDPRFGETTYRLTNLLRGEQARSLFEPPSDYKIEEGGRGGVRIEMKERAK